MQISTASKPRKRSSISTVWISIWPGFKTTMHTLQNIEKKHNSNSFILQLARLSLFLAVLQFPSQASCEPNGGFLKNLFWHPAGVKEVATKIATLKDNDNGGTWGLDFSPDGKHLAVTPFGSSPVHIWDWRSNNIIHALDKPNGGNSDATEPIRYSPNGSLLAICHTPTGNELSTRIWNTETWEVVQDIKDAVKGGGCRAIDFTNNNKSMIRLYDRSLGYVGASFYVYDTQSWNVSFDITTNNRPPFLPGTLTISQDGKYAAIGGRIYLGGIGVPARDEGHIAIIDMMSKSVISSINIRDKDEGTLAWSPDGLHLAYAGPDELDIFDVESGRISPQPSKTIPGYSKRIRYTPDGKYFIERVFDDGRKLVRIWDAQHQILFQEIRADAYSIAVSRDGHYLAMGMASEVSVWELK